MPTTAMSSPSMASVMPCRRAEAVCDAMQYVQPLVALTARYTSSLVSGSSAPGAMTCLTLSQVRRRSGGWLASAFQKLLTASVFRVAMMSSYTARTSPVASAYSMSLTVAISTPSCQSCLPRGAASAREELEQQSVDLRRVFVVRPVAGAGHAMDVAH